MYIKSDYYTYDDVTTDYDYNELDNEFYSDNVINWDNINFDNVIKF